MPSKLDFYARKSSNQAGQLRSHLQSLEDDAFALAKQDKAVVLDYLTRMDAAQSLFDELDTKGGPDLTPESLRFTTLQERLQKKAPQLLDRLDGSSALQAVRPAGAAPDRASWWFFDREVARRRAGLAKRIAIIGGAVLILVLIVVILFNTILKPDPATMLRTQKFQAAMELASTERDYLAALAQIEEALDTLPDDPELLVFKGVLLAELNRSDEAEPLFERVSNLDLEPEFLPLARGQILLQLGRADAALEAGQQAVALNPDSAEAWFLTGRAHTVLEQIDLAYEALSKAADLAFEQGNDTLYAIIKINLGYLQPAPELTP